MLDYHWTEKLEPTGLTMDIYKASTPPSPPQCAGQDYRNTKTGPTSGLESAYGMRPTERKAQLNRLWANNRYKALCEVYRSSYVFSKH